MGVPGLDTWPGLDGPLCPQIPEIIHFCCDFLTPWVDEDNILDVYRLAELFDLKCMISHVICA